MGLKELGEWSNGAQMGQKPGPGSQSMLVAEQGLGPLSWTLSSDHTASQLLALCF